MPLIKCLECGKEYSDKSQSCINCGCPTESNQKVKVSDDECSVEIKGDEAKYYGKMSYANIQIPYIWVIQILYFILMVVLFIKAGTGNGIGLLFLWFVGLYLISWIKYITPWYWNKRKELTQKAEDILVIQKYLQKRFKILSEVKPSYKTLDVINVNEKNKETSMFLIYMKAYELNADAIVINSDTVTTKVQGSVSTSRLIGGSARISGHTSSTSTNNIMATIIKY